MRELDADTLYQTAAEKIDRGDRCMVLPAVC